MKTMDKRILQTKEKLKNALIFLLENSELENITVSRLCNQAGVNRSTFYVHYSNISECFEEITDAVIKEMRASLYNEPIRNQNSFLLVYFRTARKYQTIFRTIHKAGIHDSMIHKMVNINNEILHNQLYIPFNNENLEYSFVFSGFYGMVETWLRNGCKESDEELILILKNFSGGKL